MLVPCRGEERSGEKMSGDFHMKSSSSEESVRKRTHSVGANSLAPSMLSTMTTANICDINDVIMDPNPKQENVIGRFPAAACAGLSLISVVAASADGEKIQKYVYHDEPHSFETSMEYVVLASNNNNNSTMLSEQLANDLDISTGTTNVSVASVGEHIYSNSHFKFEVLETTV